MLQILKEYEENNIKIVEYTRDGINISHTVKTPIQQEVVSEETQEVSKLTTDEQLMRLQQDNVILMDAIATMYEELILGGNL